MFISIYKVFMIIYRIILYLPKSDGATKIHRISSKIERNGFPGDGFGSTVDSSKDFIIVGCPNDNINGTSDYGSSIIYRVGSNTFDYGYKIFPDDGFRECYFGRSVAIDNKRAIIGSRYDNYSGPDKPFGSAYVYRYEEGLWELETKLIASDGAIHDGFGYAVDIDNHTAVVSSFKDDDNGWNSGSVYLFIYNGYNWSQSLKILANDTNSWDLFGYAVNIYTDTIAVGAISHKSKNVKNSGAVYIFTDDGNSTWILRNKLEPSTPYVGGFFGRSIDIDNDILVVGASGEDSNSGSAYVYQKNSSGHWLEKEKLVASDKTVGSNFGWSVSLHGNNIVVGSRDSDNNGTNSGAVYIFQYSNGHWKEIIKLLAQDGSTNHWFGRSVSIQNERVFVGRYSDKLKNNGSVYIYDIVSFPIVIPPVTINLVAAIIVPLIITLIAAFFIFKFRVKISKCSNCRKEMGSEVEQDTIMSTRNN